VTGAAGLALGTVQWGLAYGIANRTGRPNFNAVCEMLEIARPWLSFLDTARGYGDSERVIGEATDGDPHWSIVTKLSSDANTPLLAVASLAASRQALRRDRLDVVLLHRWAHRCAVWDVLRRERDAGEIAQLGASAGDPDEAWAMLADQDVQVIQVATSLFDQRLSRARFFERATEAGKTVFVRSVFLQGTAQLPPDRLPRYLAPLTETSRNVQQWAFERGVSTTVPFLAFASSLPGAWLLLGCESVAQLADNLRDRTVAAAFVRDISPLAESVTELPADVLNPALWPKL